MTLFDLNIDAEELVNSVLLWWEDQQEGDPPVFIGQAKNLKKRFYIKNIRQAATALQVTGSYVRLLCLSGKLKGAYKEGNRWRIPSNAINQYKATRRGPGRPRSHGSGPESRV